jgi:nitrite reductase/ring-hydroxylating ferredoxin subunit
MGVDVPEPRELPLAVAGPFPDVPKGQARGVTLANGTELVLVRRDGALHIYENRCPHQGTPLETFPNKFLNSDGSLLICSTHGARFRVEDGLCVSGPCLGQRLRRAVLTPG